MKLFVMYIAVFFIGLYAAESSHTGTLTPSTSQVSMQNYGQLFVQYRDAVGLYLQNNPTFTGNVTSAMLTAQGSTIPASFLALVGNQVTATGANGRILTCYGALPGALPGALKATGNDASLGTSSGANWTNAVYGTSSALAVAVPAGDIVSVYQVGT